jgi:hypothetical protein
MTWAVVLATMNWWWPWLFGDEGWADSPPRRSCAACRQPVEKRAGSLATVRQLAKRKALEARVQSLRCQIDMYVAQHGGRYPGVASDGRFHGVLFARQLTCRTNAEGHAVSRRRPRPDHPFGPYIRHVPANPLVPGRTASLIAGGPGAPPRDGKTGWWFDTEAGMLHSNHSEGPPPAATERASANQGGQAAVPGLPGGAQETGR